MSEFAGKIVKRKKRNSHFVPRLLPSLLNNHFKNH